MKIVFMGTPDFAVPPLERLYDLGYEVEAVVTKPDQKRGRGQKVTFSPVKELALKHNTEILQPDRVKGNLEFVNKLKALKPDIIVVVAYGKILPEEVLAIPKHGCVNIHGSLLPKYRGAAPIHWALINGDKETGVTTMLMDSGMDTGDMLLKAVIPITDEDDVASLHVKLSNLGAQALVETLEKLKAGTITPVKQEDKQATYAPMVFKDLGKLEWNKDTLEIFNKVRGLNPWPGCYTFLNGQRLKIHKCQITHDANLSAIPGTIVDINKGGICVKTKDGILQLTIVQPENKPKMEASSYANGYNIKRGEKFD